MHTFTHSHTDCGVSPDDHGTNQGLSKDYGDPGAPGGPLTSAGGGPLTSAGGGPLTSAEGGTVPRITAEQRVGAGVHSRRAGVPIRLTWSPDLLGVQGGEEMNRHEALHPLISVQGHRSRKSWRSVCVL